MKWYHSIHSSALMVMPCLECIRFEVYSTAVTTEERDLKSGFGIVITSSLALVMPV